jgi:putative ABC transport system ATP-binding protein
MEPAPFLFFIPFWVFHKITPYITQKTAKKSISDKNVMLHHFTSMESQTLKHYIEEVKEDIIMSIIETIKLEKSYGDTRVLRGIDLKIEPGQFSAIMGPSGSGKTTLLNVLSTIDQLTGGDVLIDQQSLLSMNRKQISDFRRDKLGFIFQDYNLLDTLTVKENIFLPLSLKKCKIDVMEQRLAPLVAALHIEDILEKYPYEISGGQKQRTAAARAMITNPLIIFADEPTGALDSRSASQLLEQLSTLNQKLGATILMVTHDPFAASYCGRVIFLKDGVIRNDLYRGEYKQGDFFNRILDIHAVLGGVSGEPI